MHLIRLWLRTAIALRTPFVFFQDTQYRFMDDSWWSETIALGVKTMHTWEENFFDCDDFAWIMKSICSRKHENSIGVVWGLRRRRGHTWNVILMADQVLQLEPQTGLTGRRLKGYWPVVAII